MRILVLSPHTPQDPQDIYLEGSRVEYTCTNGFYLMGPNLIECQADQTWSSRPGLCTGRNLLPRQQPIL